MNARQAEALELVADYHREAPKFAAALIDIAKAGEAQDAQREAEAVTRAMDALRNAPMLTDVLLSLLGK